jgi:hypothetical protein
MTAGRINQVSISTLSHRLGARSADVAISILQIQPVSPLRQSDTTYSQYRLANVRMLHKLRYECINFAL